MTLDTITPFLGPVADLLTDPDVNEVRITPFGQVYVERLACTFRLPAIINPTDREFAASNIAASINRPLDGRNPDIDVRLEDGSRVAILCPPASPNGINITIRRFPRSFTLTDLEAALSIETDDVPFLQNLVRERQNILISGATRTGKTTFLSALVREIPRNQRLVLIEKPTEIQVDDAHSRDLLQIEVSDAFDSRRALTATLRHSPDRIILGEVRDTEAYWFLQALNTGHAGSFTTIHANSASDALRRLAHCARAAQPNLLPELVAEDIAAAVQYVIHLAITDQPTPLRYVKTIAKVAGIASDNRTVLLEPESFPQLLSTTNEAL